MWTWAAACQKGTSHERTGTARQDAFRCVVVGEECSHLIAIVCDGAGSASHGGEGAMIASRALSQIAKAYVASTGTLPDDETAREWIDLTRDQIATLASRRDLKSRDFATTVVMVITDGADTLLLHIGDGAAVARCVDSGEWMALSWPEHGEFASTTYFITDEAVVRLRLVRHSAPIDRVALFTDGIERLVLKLAERVPQAPFFSMISEPIAQSFEVGVDRDLSRKLGAYLTSPAVNERTDDDKTLIVACRR